MPPLGVISTEIRNQSPIAVGIDANHAIVRARQTVGASGASQYGVQLAIEKGNVGDTTDQTSKSLIRRQTINHCRAGSVRTDFGNTCGEAARIRSNWRYHLITQASARSGSTCSAFCNIEVSVEAELKSSRIVEASSKYRDV
jgi:hypothetical protein